MRKASTALLEQGIQTPSPAPDLIPAETSTENLHWDRYIGRGHFRTFGVDFNVSDVVQRARENQGKTFNVRRNELGLV